MNLNSGVEDENGLAKFFEADLTVDRTTCHAMAQERYASRSSD